MKSPAKQLTEKLASLVEERRALQAKRDWLINALPPHEDLERAIDVEVDAHAATFTAEHALALARAAAGRLDVGPDHTIRGVVPGSIANWLYWPIDFATLCGLAGEVVKANLRAILQSATFDSGPPLADRAALVAAVDAKNRQVEAEHTALCDDAAEDGVPLPYLPEVSARQLATQRHAEDVRLYNEKNADAIKRGVAKAMQ